MSMMALWPAIVPALAAALIAWVLTPLAGRLAIRVGAVDVPGRRKVHEHPTPRLGGLAVVTSMAVVWAGAEWLAGPVLPDELARGLSFGLLPLLAISVLDDVRSVRASFKFLAHLLAASLAVGFGVSLGADVHLFGPIHLGVFAAPLSVVWLVGITNAFNLIDGLDGLSAGLGLIAALTMAAVFGLVGQPAMAGAALVMAGALAGFLPSNVHPARQFLGDSGATAIGFCLGAFALKGGSTLSSGFAALVPVFVMGLPIADALITMARRAVRRMQRRGGNIFDADRNHIHHRLLALGIDHRRAVLFLYGAGVALAILGLGSMFLKAQDAALFVMAVLVAAFVGVHRLGYDEFAFIRRGTMLRVYDVSLVQRAMFAVCVDLATTAVAAYAALGLKLDAWHPRVVGGLFADLALVLAPLTAAIFWYTGMYRGGWRVASVTDLAHAAGAALAVAAAGVVVHRIVSPVPQPPSVFLIYALVSVVLVAVSRGSYVVLLSSERRASMRGVPTLLYGAGLHGMSAVSVLLARPTAGLRPIGFIDDDPSRTGGRVSGVPVLGTPKDLDKLAARYRVGAVLLTAPDGEGESVARTAAACERLGIPLLRTRLLLDPYGATIAAPPAPGAVGVMPALSSAPVAVARFVESEPCARCGSRNLRRSKVRGAVERFRKLHAARRPFRCEDCGWRGWLLPLEQAMPFADAAAAAGGPPADDLVAAADRPRGTGMLA